MSGLDISDVPAVQTRRCAHCGGCNPLPKGWVACCWNPIGCECATRTVTPARKLDVELRPQVTLEPCVTFGRPTIRGVPVDVVGGRVWAGDSVADVADDFGWRREDVIVACWYLARYGSDRYRKRWGPWLAEVEQQLWHSRFDVPDPPAKEE